MEVLDFINTHKDWEDVLTQPPYCIKINRDGRYMLLKYNQLGSDFTLSIVRECRGSIFYLNDDDKYECVCRAFDKFGNYGESYVKDIDWNSAIVEEKIDGSLIKFWFHNNEWHISTNGTIDAFKAQIGETELTFGDLANKAIGYSSIPSFIDGLDTTQTYMFELVSPLSKMTIYYPQTQLYYLGQRDMNTFMESKQYTTHMEKYGILRPKTYALHTLKDCLSYVQQMTKDEEGFVIMDGNRNRVKLKSPEYLLAFHMHNNGVITVKRVIEMIKHNMLDDFMAYCPEYRQFVDNVVEDIICTYIQLEIDWLLASVFAHLPRKEFAEHIKSRENQEFLWIKYDHPKTVAQEYLMNKPTNKIKEMIEQYKRRRGDNNELSQ